MKHAEKLIGRIIFLEALPIVSKLNEINIGGGVGTQHKNDCASETGAIKANNQGIRLLVEAGDNGTRELFDSILKDEETHIDWLEAQLDQINQMAIRGRGPWYLARAKALSVGLSNAYFKPRGLPSLIEEDCRQRSNRRVQARTHGGVAGVGGRQPPLWRSSRVRVSNPGQAEPAASFS